MATSADADLAARLLERLLSDPAFRARFRRDPAGACREAGLDELAQEMSLGGGKAMHTLDIRESKSSLAGVMMAAAMEGVAIYQFTENILPHLEEIPGQIADVLSRVDLPAIPDALRKPPADVTPIPKAVAPPGTGLPDEGAGDGTAGSAAGTSGNPAGSAAGASEGAAGSAANAGVSEGAGAAAASGTGADGEASRGTGAADGAAGGTGADDGAAGGTGADDGAAGRTGADDGARRGASRAGAGATGDDASDGAAGRGSGAAGKGGGAAGSTLPTDTSGGENAAAQEAARRIAEETSPEAAERATREGAASALDERTTGVPSSSDLPTAAPPASSSPPDVPPPANGPLPTTAPVTPPAAAPSASSAPPVGSSLPTSAPAAPHSPAPLPGEPAAAPPSEATPGGRAATAATPPPEAAPGAPAPTAATPPPEAAPGGRAATAATPPPEAAPGAPAPTAATPPPEAAPGAPADVVPTPPPEVATRSKGGGIGAALRKGAARFAPGAGKSADTDGVAPSAAAGKSATPDGAAAASAPSTSPPAGAAPATGAAPVGSSLPTATPPATGASDPAAAPVGSSLPTDAPPATGDGAPVGSSLPSDAPPATGDGAPVGSSLPTDAADGGSGAGRGGIDPSQFGVDGTGGKPDREALALLKNKNVVLDSDGIKDLKAGRVDPRAVAVITKLSSEHKLTVTALCSDREEPAVSAHKLGRGFDIAAIDGERVSPDSPLAREVAAELAELDRDYRPDEIGSPFAIAEPGYFTDADHQDHLHVGFKEPISPDWKPPKDVAAPEPAAPKTPAPAPAAPPPAAPTPPAVAASAPAPPPVAAAAPPPEPRNQSQLFMRAVSAKAAAADADEVARNESLSFLKAIDPKPAPAAFASTAEPQATAAAVPAGTAVPGAAEAVPGAPGAIAAAVDPAAAGGPNPLGAAALQVAETQLGVRETGGANRGPQVDEYLAAAQVPPGNPWCASFITWAMEKVGHKMPGGGWAAVATWVRNAEQGANGLKLVSAEDARPGDIVAYDWGGQSDFGADGHIGFLESTVEGGKFTALEGNNADAVSRVPRQLGSANIVFIRAEGTPTGGAAPATPQSAAPAAVGTTTPQSATPAAAGTVTPQGAVAEQATVGGQPEPIDPAQFGAEGTGGTPGPEALALLKNKNVVFDADGIEDIKAGRIDPRAIAVLTKLSAEHKITVTCMCSDHDKFTAGGSVSNHHYGRGFDIGSIDGEIVGPGSPLARAVASELSSLDPSYRPNEIGSPFAISGPGYFTDAGHQDHLHIGFKEAIAPDWKPPADVAAPAAAAPVAAQAAAIPPAPVAQAAAVPAATAPAAAPPPPERRDASQLFLQAVSAKAAAADAKRVATNASASFLKAIDPPAQQPAAFAAADPGTPAADPAAATGAPAVADVATTAAAAPDAYPGDNAPREQIAAWMAGQAEKRGLPPQLPLMASLVESGMKNVNYGDADSVGFFQMRVGIWNQGAYAGYPENPELQVKWFLDQAEAVKRQRLVAGKSVTDPNQFGEWVADVERPAEQYRGRYQLRLEEANALLRSAPAQPAAAPVDPTAAAVAIGDAKLPSEILAPVQEAIAAGSGPGPRALKAIEEASKYIGTDYKWGGSTPQTGFDCSGLMQWSYAQSGVQIPRVTYTQIEASNGTEIADRAALKPGDLVFFSNQGDVHHVGMYLGGDKFLHAPSTGDVVKVSSLNEPYYAGQFAGGRRFDGGAPVAAPAPVAAAASTPAIDPTAIAQAQAAVARDAAEVRRNNSQLFQAVVAEQATKEREQRRSLLFLKAIDPAQVKRPASASAAAPPAPAAAPPPAPAAAPPVAPAAPAAAAPVPPAAATAPVAPPPEAAPASVAAASIDLTSAATEYPGDGASQGELARWLARQAEKAGLPPELPVMASLVESGVKNLNHGDADSVGFFQMRVGIWNQGAYAGYPEKPELQAKWFIDQALALKRKRIAAGDASFGQDPNTWGEWIADVERPAEQYRGRYQLRLAEARTLLSG